MSKFRTDRTSGINREGSKRWNKYKSIYLEQVDLCDKRINDMLTKQMEHCVCQV
jgi:hypothetical protein